MSGSKVVQMRILKRSETEAANAKEMGNVAFKSEDYQTALNCYEKCLNEIAVKSNSATLSILHGNCAAAHLKLKQFEKALEHASASLDCAQNEKGYFRKGTALMNLNRYSEAKDIFAEGKHFTTLLSH